MNYDREIERYRKEKEKTSISINACVRLIAQKDPKLGAKLRKLISKYIGSPSKKRASIMSKIKKLISKVKMKSNFIVDSSTVKNIIDSYSNLDSNDKNRLAYNIDNPLDEIVNYLYQYNSDDMALKAAEIEKVNAKEIERKEESSTMTPIESTNTRASETYSRSYNSMASRTSIPTPTQNYGGSSFIQRDVPREQIGGGISHDPGFDSSYRELDQHGLPNTQIGGGVSHDPNFDSAYRGLDQHGLPNTQIGGGVSHDPGFDSAYRGLDQHGLPNTQMGGGVSHDPNFDSAYRELDQHGLPNTQIGGGVSHDPGFDSAYRELDQHGMPGVQIGGGLGYDPGFDSAYRELDQHGMSGVRIGTAQTEEERELENKVRLMRLYQRIISAEEITNDDYDEIYSLPDDSIKYIIQRRYIKTMKEVESHQDDKKTDMRIAKDFEFIHAMLSDRNLFGKDMDVSPDASGSELKDIFDLLNDYEKKINASNLKFKDSLLEMVKRVRNKAISKAEELGHSQGTRAM